MKKLGFLILALVSTAATRAGAQIPIVQVYLDADLTAIHRECPPFATVDTVYVVARGFTSPIVDIEYRIDTHANFVVVQELLPMGFSSAGLAGVGVVVTFGGPADASGNLLVERIVGGWFCNCGGSAQFPYITVEPHPDSGKIQATQWPDLTKIEATGGYNSLCPVLPVTPSTWGGVKALYR